MRRLLVVLLTALAAMLVVSTTAHADSVSSVGTNFWLGFPENYEGTAQDTIFITGTTATTGTVSVPGLSFTQAYTVTPGTVTRVDLPAGVEPTGDDTVSPLGINVTAGAPVSAYGLSNFDATSDAYLGLPDSALGTSYTVLAWGSGAESSELSIVGSQDGTVVTITPSVSAGGHAAGTPYTVTLNQGDEYQVRADDDPQDLTGTKITSTKPVNVFGGNQCANIPSNSYVACDYVVQDIPPESAWGNSFLTVPLKTRTGGDTLEMVADTDNTQVSINGSVVATLDAGQSYTSVGVTSQSVITSTKPILLGQYSNSSSYDGTTGDPFFMLIPPTAQFLNQYTITTPTNADPGDDEITFTNYLNLVVPTDADSGVMLDGSTLPASDFSPIGSSGFSGAQVDIGVGSHTLSDNGNPFGVYTYGFASYNGYGYPGGFALGGVASVSQLSLTPSAQTAKVGTQACVTATVKNNDSTPAVGVNVGFSVSGANTAAGQESTNASGQAVFCYTGTKVSPPNDTVTASVGLSLKATASVTFTKSGGGNYCEYGEYNQYGECCVYGQYQQCTSPSSPGGNTTSPSQTISSGATPAGVTVKSTALSTLVNVNLPAGTAWRKFYIYTVHGVSFGADHSYKQIKKDVLLFNGKTKLTYNITQLSRPHGRVHLVLKKAVTASTFKVNRNVFEFTPKERRLIKRLKITKTTVSVQVTTTTGKVYTVHFKTAFGALVVIKFH